MTLFHRLFAVLLLSCATTAFAAPPKAVSVGGGVTEIVYAMGAESQLAGADTSSTWPAAARQLPQVGYQRALSAEGTLSLRPAVVLASHEAGPPHVLEQLAKAGVKIAPIDGAYTFEGLQQRVIQVGDALQQQAAAKALNDRLAGEWQQTLQQITKTPALGVNGKPLKVAVVISHGGHSMAAGDGTPAAAMLALAGVENAFAGQFREFKPLSPESLAAAAPDVIVAALTRTEGFDAQTFIKGTPGLTLTPAGRDGRVIGVDIVRFMGFGPRLPEAVADLHNQLIRP